MRFAVELIDPSRARALLAKNIRNRPLNGATVTKYAADMGRAQWASTGDTIKVGRSGALLDGQHRLEAVVKADVAVQFCVVYDVPDEAFDSIDVGRVRKSSDVLAMLGHKNYTTLSSAARLLYLEERGAMDMSSYSLIPSERTKAVTNHDVIKTVEGCPDLVQCVEDTMTTYRMAGTLISYGLAAFLLFKFRRLSMADADRFFSGLTDGLGLTANDPVFLLRERLIRNQGEKRKLQRREIYVFVIKAWNAGRTRKPFTANGLRLRSSGPSAESTPPQPV